MAIADNALIGRRIAYSCCAAKKAHKYMVQRAKGKYDCAEKTMLEMKFLHLAADIMDAYPTSTQVMGEVCVSEDLVCATIRLADPGCVVCCGDEEDPDVDPCELSIDYTVLAAIPDTDVALAPDGTYLITEISGFPIAVIANVASGAYSIQFVLPDGYIVYATVTDTYYSAFAFITTLLYPGITVGTIVPGLYDVISDNAPYAFAQNRGIIIEATEDNLVWTPVYVGVEQDIAVQLTVNTVLNLPVPVPNPIGFRIKYTTNEGACTYGPVDASVFNTTPPLTNAIVVCEAVFPDEFPATVQKGTILGPAFTTEATITGTGVNDFKGLHFASDDPSKMVAGSSFGRLIFSGDSGDTWPVPGGNWAASPDIADINVAHFDQFGDDNVGTIFVAGEGGVLARSLDYGATFDWVDQTGITGDVRSVGAVGGQNDAIVGTLANGIWKTDDGGTTWTQVLAITDEVKHIQVIGSIVLAFTPVGVYRSADSGVTWPVVPNSTLLDGMDSDVLGSIVVVAAQTGRYKSIDGGFTWMQQSVGVHLSACIVSSQICLYVDGNGNVVTISTDGGVSTTPMNIGAYQYYAWKIRAHIYP